MLKITRCVHILPRILFSKRADRKHRCDVLQGHSQIPSRNSAQVSCQQRLQVVTMAGRGNQGEKQNQNQPKIQTHTAIAN